MAGENLNVMAAAGWDFISNAPAEIKSNPQHLYPPYRSKVMLMGWDLGVFLRGMGWKRPSTGIGLRDSPDRLVAKIIGFDVVEIRGEHDVLLARFLYDPTRRTFSRVTKRNPA